MGPSHPSRTPRRFSRALRGRLGVVCVLGAGLVTGCDTSAAAPAGEPAGVKTAAAAQPTAAPPAKPADSAARANVPERCPEGMLPVPGGRFWAGSPAGRYAPEESPRFETRVADFCMDKTEVTVAAYQKCVASGDCKPAHTTRRFCNVRRDDRGKHPINCVDWHMAVAYCEAHDARLPSEIEWEYAARGGERDLKYPWGNDPPSESNTCWKHVGGSCEVGELPAGAFGLLDISGNVWEWTSSDFGAYPWPPVEATTKVYRGGSWSRRFEKWMRPQLRNRYRPSEWGSHLGFRCVKTLKHTRCPYGRSEDGKACRHGVEKMDCGPGESFNGVRCAAKGEPTCPSGSKQRPGHGCVGEGGTTLSFASLPEKDTTPVTRSRSPEFDGDCQQHYPGRPTAYRYAGGTHAARNAKKGAAGCSNRDVGVGWNSCCCP